MGEDTKPAVDPAAPADPMTTPPAGDAVPGAPAAPADPMTTPPAGETTPPAGDAVPGAPAADPAKPTV